MIDKKISGAFLYLPFANAPGKQPKAPAASLTESTSNTTTDYFARIRLLIFPLLASSQWQKICRYLLVVSITPL
ncbi:TPA: hypothetical protein ACGAD2_002916 [Salmonella enterica subsp. enterica serovar Newport]